MTGSHATLRVTEADDRVVVNLDQPDVRNSLNARAVHDLNEMCDALEREPRILILTSAAGYFASGADLGEMADADAEFALNGQTRRLIERVAALPLPVVAAVDGYAIGGGAELAYACDLRIASTRAIFSNPELSLGVTAAAGGCWRLPQLVGTSVAKLMLYTGYQLDAEAALRHGLVSDVVAPEDLMTAAHRLVDEICTSSSLALRVTKAMLDSNSLHPAVDAMAQAVLLTNGTAQARIQAFLDSRRRRKTT